MFKVGIFQLCVSVLMTKMENVRINLFIYVKRHIIYYNAYIILLFIYYLQL